MPQFGRVCFACLRSSNDELIDVSTQDRDDIRLIDKLRSCVSEALEHSNFKLLCLSCKDTLQKAYSFQQMVLQSQDYLNKIIFQDPLANDYEPLILIKENNSDSTENELKVEYDCTASETGSTYENSQIDSDFNDCLKADSITSSQVNDHLEYCCYYCRSVFDKRWKLRQHVNSTHVQKETYVCNFCNKTFKQLYHLKQHLTTHTREKKYKCSFCSKSFQRLSSMHRHTQSHKRAPGQKTKKTPFLCTVCGKSFPYSNGVQRHMRVHTGVRNHECPVCLQRFSQTTHLHVHMRRHTGEKPYVCDTCGGRFTLNASLLKHMKSHK